MYASMAEWLAETENYAARHERLAEDVRSGTVAAVLPWLETAWRLGEETVHRDRIKLEAAIVALIDAVDARDQEAINRALFVGRGLTF